MDGCADPEPTLLRRLMHGLRTLPGLCLGACVLYVLSVGPMRVASYRSGFPSDSMLRSYSSALRSVAVKTSTFDVLAMYERWWIVLCYPQGGYKYMPRPPLPPPPPPPRPEPPTCGLAIAE